MSVSTQVIAQIRARTATFLTDTCTIERRPAATDTYGYGDNGWATAHSGVACRILLPKPSASQYVVGAGEEGITEYPMIFGIETDVLEGDRISINGAKYEVLEIQDIQTNAVFLGVSTAKIGNG